MASLWLTAQSPLARAARGWPATPGLKPTILTELDTNNPVTRGMVNYWPITPGPWEPTDTTDTGRGPDPYLRDVLGDGDCHTYFYNRTDSPDFLPSPLGVGLTYKNAAAEITAGSYNNVFDLPKAGVFACVYVDDVNTDQFIIGHSNATVSPSAAQLYGCGIGIYGGSVVLFCATNNASQKISIPVSPGLLQIAGNIAANGTGHLAVNGQIASGQLGNSSSYEFGLGLAAISRDSVRVRDQLLGYLLHAGAYNRYLTEAELLALSRDSFQVLRPANQSPFIIGTTEAPPLDFYETALVSATGTLTASEVYAPPASEETALVSTAATVTATETFDQAVYDETALISASVALDATGEVYTPPVSNESALVSITTAVNAVETFVSPAYDETALVSTLATITSEDAYTAPGDAFFESGRIAIATTVTAAETYTAPAYTETGLVSFSALVEASELYFPPGSFQTAQIVISTTLDAVETWAPPATDQQALISFTGGITAREIFNTPSALPDGLSAITAIKYGGLKARIVRWDN